MVWWWHCCVYIRILRVYLLVSSIGHFLKLKSLFYRLKKSLRYENDFFHNVECLCNNNTNTNFLTILIPNLFYINSIPLVNNFTLHCCRILRRDGLPNFSKRRNYENYAISSTIYFLCFLSKVRANWPRYNMHLHTGSHLREGKEEISFGEM